MSIKAKVEIKIEGLGVPTKTYTVQDRAIEGEKIPALQILGISIIRNATGSNQLGGEPTQVWTAINSSQLRATFFDQLGTEVGESHIEPGSSVAIDKKGTSVEISKLGSNIKVRVTRE